MNPPVEFLQIAARRYCTERFGLCAERYERLEEAGGDRSGPNYTQEAYRTFPRYQVLSAIKTEVERLTGTDMGSLDDARDLLALAGQIADDAFTRYDDPDAQVAVLEEREAFVRFVREVSEDVLNAIEPLPFIRVLSTEESGRVWGLVERAWGLKRREYWFPLTESERGDLVPFQAHHFLRFTGPERLEAILAKRGVTRVWELREYGPEYELEVSAFEPSYDGAEGFWTSATLDWIVYASHEGSITLGGWMLPEVQQVWPEWSRRIWTTPFFD